MSERLGVWICELFKNFCSASCLLQVNASSTFERNKAKAHSESGEAASDKVEEISYHATDRYSL